MELEIHSTVWIDTDYIIRHVKDNDMTVEEAVNFEIASLDDCEYYLIGAVEREKIIKKVKEMLDKQ